MARESRDDVAHRVVLGARGRRASARALGDLGADREPLPQAVRAHAEDQDLTARRATLAGVVGPVGFLVVSFAMAAMRPELIRAQGWASWPSSMALGGAAGLPQVLAFLWLAACYPVFALGALRPVLGVPAAWGGFLGVAAGDVLLAFPTDAADASTSWHGTLHLAGVFIATAATVVAAVAVTTARWRRPSWRPWTLVGAPVVAAGVAIGLIAGFEQGWAKVAYVLCVTAPIPLLALLVRREALGT